MIVIDLLSSWLKPIAYLENRVLLNYDSFSKLSKLCSHTEISPVVTKKLPFVSGVQCSLLSL